MLYDFLLYTFLIEYSFYTDLEFFNRFYEYFSI